MGPMTTTPKPVECWLTDMDGVLVHEERAIPGASDFIKALVTSGRRFLVLTNNSIFTPRDLRARLSVQEAVTLEDRDVLGRTLVDRADEVAGADAGLGRR